MSIASHGHPLLRASITREIQANASTSQKKLSASVQMQMYTMMHGYVTRCKENKRKRQTKTYPTQNEPLTKRDTQHPHPPANVGTWLLRGVW